MIKDLKELYAYRQMIFSLVKKDLRGRYKGSVLGFMWTFINPLLQMGVYTLVFSIILRNDIDKYYVFLFVALVPLIFFSASLTGGGQCSAAVSDVASPAGRQCLRGAGRTRRGPGCQDRQHDRDDASLSADL